MVQISFYVLFKIVVYFVYYCICYIHMMSVGRYVPLDSHLEVTRELWIASSLLPLSTIMGSGIN